jgi:energy-coupling factor transport system permease protein
MSSDAIRQGRRRSTRRGGIDAVLLRRLPHDSSMQRLAVETKLIGMTALTIATGLNTGWAQLIGVGAIAAATVIAARVPWRAVPRLPVWFFALIAIGFALAAAGGGAGRYLRLLGFALLFIVLSLVIAWTTELGGLAPALQRLGAPLRRVGVPIDDWAITAALSLRCLPLMLEEGRAVVAARRQRQISRHPAAVAAATVDVITASMAAAVRRAADLGDVIALRGGPAPPSRPTRGLQLRDGVALALVATASAVPSMLF